MTPRIYFPEADILDKMYALRNQIYECVETADLKRAEYLFGRMRKLSLRLADGSAAANAADKMITDTWRYYLWVLGYRRSR